MSQPVTPSETVEDKAANSGSSTQIVRVQNEDRRGDFEKAKTNMISRINLWNFEVDDTFVQYRDSREVLDQMSKKVKPEAEFDAVRLRTWRMINNCEASIQNISQLLNLFKADWSANRWCGKHEVLMDLKIEVTRQENIAIKQNFSDLEDLKLRDDDDEIRQHLGGVIHALATGFDQLLTLARGIVFYASAIEDIVAAEKRMRAWVLPTPYPPNLASR